MRCDAMQCEAMRYSEGMVSTNTFLFWFCGYKHISAVRVMSAAVELLDRYSNRARLLLSSFLHSWQALSVVSERGITPPTLARRDSLRPRGVASPLGPTVSEDKMTLLLLLLLCL